MQQQVNSDPEDVPFPLVQTEYIKLPSFTNIYSYARVGDVLLIATERDVHAVQFACQSAKRSGPSSSSSSCESLGLLQSGVCEDASIISMHAIPAADCCKGGIEKKKDALPVIGITVRDNATEAFWLLVYGSNHCSADWQGLRTDCLKVELSFTPFVLSHSLHLQGSCACKQAPSSSVEFFLSGSDTELHRYRFATSPDARHDDGGESAYDRLEHAGCVSQLDKLNLTSAVLSFDVMHTEKSDETWLALSCQDGTVGLLNLNEVESASVPATPAPSASATAKIGMQHQTLDGPGVCMLFFRHSVPQTTFLSSSPSSSPSVSASSSSATDRDQSFAVLYQRAQSKFEHESSIYSEQVPDVHLAIGSAMGYCTIVRHVTYAGLELDSLLPESDRYDSILCMWAADIDMDGVKEVIVGTYSQRLLVYKLTPFGHGLDSKRREAVHSSGQTHDSYGQNYYQLVHVVKTSGPVYAIDTLDVAGIAAVVVMTMFGVELFQWDTRAANEHLQSKVELCEEIEELERTLQHAQAR
jgi:hypothetical protein